MSRINVPTPIRFECQKGCANCCKISDGFVLIREKEVKEISKFLKISETEFLKEYTQIKKGILSLIDHDGKDCIFLKDEKCSVYPVRPIQCQTYPFWPQNLKALRRWYYVEEDCPGIGKGRTYTKEEIEEIFTGKPVNSEK